MARVWIGLVLLLLVVVQVAGRGGHGGGGGPLPEGAGWVLFAIFAIPIGFCCLIIALCSTACDDGTEDQRREIENNLVASTKPSDETEVCEEERLFPSRRIQVQLVDDQLINMEVPPVELILTDITMLFSDLTAYVGVPDVHGLLVLDFESGDFIQVFDMLRIPQGNVKVRVVTFDNNKFLRLYPSIE